VRADRDLPAPALPAAQAGGEALQSRVEDRRTDVALEEIERSVGKGEDAWWEE